ncbi:DHH family phosphoesterase [Tannockella kyphosi]|uniref:DHH family phosphoesterase n=1 Tax=Tannockella kyphosi TaxID=2899121 RepID=UPI0020137068|nr:bifunctional oligoribonuclease/PAP phosphatase NrnA [Tannockella kyphosi]
MYKKIIDKIECYENIVIYRHVLPDYDAFGSQLGLYFALKETYPNKNISVDGVFTSDLLEQYATGFKRELPDFSQPVLGIVTDTANSGRIDGESYLLCKEIIKIDHHEVVDSYGVINLEDPSASSCCQMIGHMIKENNHIIKAPICSLNAIFLGVIGDSNRFMYRGTGVQTFEVASFLVENGVEMEPLYNKMYMRQEKDLRVQGYILSNYQTFGKVAYYILRQDNLEELGISREKGSDFVNCLAGIEQYNVWMAITQNVADNNWRVSIRSRGVVVNEIAGLYNGGGHKFASGAKLDTIDQLEGLLEKLEEQANV